MKTIKSFQLKLAIPILLLTGFLIPLGYQLIIVVAGTWMALEHRFNYGKWWDRDKLICHGRAGVLLIIASIGVVIIGNL